MHILLLHKLSVIYIPYTVLNAQCIAHLLSETHTLHILSYTYTNMHTHLREKMNERVQGQLKYVCTGLYIQ